ncbi:DNA topoisomerase-1 [Thiothrix caldifontis]|uniref:DNA topoisomerase 1 n=1 Tax=Thiothrix caldifontis TaxID=525918 RepID=A0A1H3ZF59_9GAMM|nr:DNA topoisomerase I [Thiothrix caldifontis]SEA22386.1 DNA topoisomerase-1 [Thiothrix caldifontis]
MSENLVIVESPAKGKTIQKYLGSGFEVLASYGHVRDLIPKEGAVDPDNGYAMRYEIIDRNQKHVDAIARALKKANNLYLATDPDREGEAISWHLYELLNERGALKGKNVQRVVFHEITKHAVQEAVANPRDLAHDLVDAQQARRALDYLVGFNLSPLLWRKIKPSLSAGRVQSPALRLIVEREEEIERFVRQEYWTMTAQNEKDAQAFSARLHTLDGHKLDQFDINNEARATEVRQRLLQVANGKLLVSKVDKKQRKRYPAPPFTTSTLQQEAVRKLKFSTQRAMRVAQQLYEGIDLGNGPVGLITYMRTDSVTLANEALAELRGLIGQRYGQDKLPETPNFYKNKSKNAQEAHEAVRPTSAHRTPEQVKSHLNEEQFRLYELIWKRTVACQMIYATLDTVSADLNAETGSFFRASGSTIRDPGFLMVYEEGLDDRASEKESPLPPLEEGESITLHDIAAEQHFTEPPPRYSEASLVKALEEYGIGRPSTYASIISTLLAREYVELDNRRFTPTDIGRIVIRFLTEHFTQYVDYDFTANLENELDEISRGEKAWVPVMDAFWQPFHQLVDEKMESVNRSDVLQSRELGIDPTSGRPVSVRLGRFGPMVQIGTKDDEEKPVFAGLRPGMKLDTVTLEEALELFKLPRQLGETEDGKAISANVGRFGPYVKYGDQFASLKKEDDPHTITLERALELIAEKKVKDAEKVLVDFGNGVQILKGRWGPYINKVIKRVKVQARLPKDREPDSMTLEECEALIAVVAEAKSAKKGAKKAAAVKPETEAADKPVAAKVEKPKPVTAKAAPKKASVAKKPAGKKTTASKKSAS